MSKKKYCCETMEEQIELTCEAHKDNMWNCPDKIIDYYWEKQEYVIPIHNGSGLEYMSIKYCPWCGKEIKTLEKN